MKIEMVIAALMALMLAAGAHAAETYLPADTIFLPARHVQVAYQTRTQRGETHYERKPQKILLIDSPLRITKEDAPLQSAQSNSLPGSGAADSQVQTGQTARASIINFAAGNSSASLPFEKKNELLAVLRISKRALADATGLGAKPASRTEMLFKTKGLRLTFIVDAKHRKAFVDFVVGDKTFVLQDYDDIDKLAKMIRTVQ